MANEPGIIGEAPTNFLTQDEADAIYLKISDAGTQYQVAGDYAEIVAAPAAADSTGTAGQIAYDATHIYVCVATDTWVRADLATWS